MKLNFTVLSFASIMLLWTGCDEEEAPPSIILPHKPAEMVSFLNLNLGDSTIRLENGADGYQEFLNYTLPAVEGVGDAEFGATLQNDSSLLNFSLAYTHEFEERTPLLLALISSDQELAYGEVNNQIFEIREHGFLFTLSEFEYPLGPGIGYSSSRIIQPSSSFFTVNRYFEGETENSIWLEGRFSVVLNGKYEGEEVSGDFFMEFPVCCFED